MRRSGKGLTTSLAIRTKRTNKKQKARNSITNINNQYFRQFLRKIRNLTYLSYKMKQVHNEPTEAYLFLLKQAYRIIKINKHIWEHTKRVKLNVRGETCQ